MTPNCISVNDLFRVLLLFILTKSSLNIEVSTAETSSTISSSTSSALVADSTITNNLVLSSSISSLPVTNDSAQLDISIPAAQDDDDNTTETKLDRKFIDNKTITEKERQAIQRFLNVSTKDRTAGDSHQSVNDQKHVLFENKTMAQEDYYVNTSVKYFDNKNGTRYNQTRLSGSQRRRIIYRPIGALSKAYKDSLSHWHQHPCYPRCHGDTSGSTTSPRRLRKHSSNKEKKKNNYGNRQYKKFHNSVLMHHTPSMHYTTEYYAWIFGAAMLSLVVLLSVCSCLIFCICGERWNLRRPKKKMHNNSEYERVDSISSMVDQNVHHEPIYEPLDDDITII